MMQRILVVLAVMVCLAAGAKAAPVNPTTTNDWHRVMQLKIGTSIHIQTIAKKKTTCKVNSVAEDGLVCTHGRESLSFPRGEVRSIKVEHRTRSALVGVGVGAGIGTGIGAAVGHATDSGGFLSGLGTEVGALMGGVIGGIAGLAIATPTDITAGTIYRIP